ncbi:MAG: hypothetical protein VX796_08400 [Pseudomonadota bacterium]|jgi:hypothetical protein|uniref:hypothetical protein n=1 Tax=Salinicola sp. TaxID=1978524 RepID=UPI001DE47932|nr:hypothetical protein [Salinicola sp.]MEC8917624.1 hypothetical protein [Pseudomonadota bacterium]MED5501276.1 hypothetical protein [Pseudomonadota bacterium]NRB55864.1 hypothetical protein [Salinicola sp.]
MAEIVAFPTREPNGHNIERYLLGRECLALGLLDPFAGWVETLESWFAAHPQARNKRNDALRALLADTWLVFHMACDRASRLEMQPYHCLRWAQLQYFNLSDFELLVIVNDNLLDLRRGLQALCQQHPPQARSDLSLHGLTQSIGRLNQQLNHFFDSDGCASRQPEWTS